MSLCRKFVPSPILTTRHVVFVYLHPAPFRLVSFCSVSHRSASCRMLLLCPLTSSEFFLYGPLGAMLSYTDRSSGASASASDLRTCLKEKHQANAVSGRLVCYSKFSESTEAKIARTGNECRTKTFGPELPGKRGDVGDFGDFGDVGGCEDNAFKEI